MFYGPNPTSLSPLSSNNHILSALGSLQRLPPSTIAILTTARCQLQTLLINHNLRLFRDGFPFRCTHGYDSNTTESRYRVSYEPYEISEEIAVPSDAGGCARVLVTLSCTRPTTAMNTNSALDKYFTWTIYLSAPADPRISRTSTLGRNLASQRASVAQVLVDPIILDPSSHHQFGQLIIRNPSVLSRALSMSLDSGEAITILPSHHQPSAPRIMTPYAPSSNGVVYVGTNNQGQQRVLLNVGSSLARAGKDPNQAMCMGAINPVTSLSSPLHPTPSWRKY